MGTLRRTTHVAALAAMVLVGVLSPSAALVMTARSPCSPARRKYQAPVTRKALLGT
jgi:hypothetical protein